jgi:hypothetical protein
MFLCASPEGLQNRAMIVENHYTILQAKGL